MYSETIAKQTTKKHERELMYEDAYRECCAKVAELSNRIMDLEKIIREYGLLIPNDHIEF